MSEKLDRLVAEKVTNATVCETSDQAEAVAKGVPFVVPWYVESDGNARARVWMRAGCDSDTWVIGKWEPSCRIDHAWEVVEHLRKRDYLLRLLDQRDLQTGVCKPTGEYDCRFYKAPNSDMAYSCHTSAPMAICLAALRAVGVPESEIQEALR